MTKRIAIADLEGVALDWAASEITCVNNAIIRECAYKFAFDHAFTRDDVCRTIVAAHNPTGYVEVPDELVEGE